jgi:tetrapyrrole methylase family protein / MazG family protein
LGPPDCEGDATGVIAIVGLGPGDFDRLPPHVRSTLLDGSVGLICRTRHHPAAAHLATKRTVVFCDDLYEIGDSFDEVYRAIVDRVLTAAKEGPVVYAVPGSPMVGEAAVRQILQSETPVEIIAAESFIDAALNEVGYDPLDRGLQILSGHDLPDPLILDKPTIIAQLDRPELLADVAAAIDRVTAAGTVVKVLVNLGSRDARMIETTAPHIETGLAGYRTSLFVDPVPGGLVGAVRTMRRLREECPWDRVQTHASLAEHLVEETFELIDAISRIPESDIDWVAYADVEDELGDVLLQVLFHAGIARQVGAFDIDDVAEVMRQKLVRRHPHVFGEVEAGTPDEVRANWDKIKETEREGSADSVLDGVPTGLPALHRAARIQRQAAQVGFDWDEASQVIPKLREEIDELARALDDRELVAAELGDLLFSVVNLARHLGVDSELALAGAINRFEDRFRLMEQDGPVSDLTLDELNERWERAKRQS